MFLNITYKKIIQEYSLDHCFVLEWAAPLLSCTKFCMVHVKTFWKNLQILLCCCDSLGVQGTEYVLVGFMVSVLLIGSNCFHYTVLRMEGSFNLLGSWIFFPFCTHYVTRSFEKMYVGHDLQIFVPWVSVMWWSSKCTVKENTECYYSGSLI
jgi:hypothetical protein